MARTRIIVELDDDADRQIIEYLRRLYKRYGTWKRVIYALVETYNIAERERYVAMMRDALERMESAKEASKRKKVKRLARILA